MGMNPLALYAIGRPAGAGPAGHWKPFEPHGARRWFFRTRPRPSSARRLMQISANGIALEVDDRGPPGGEPLLLIMGLGMQLIAWPDGLVDQLVARGFRVIRFDNRDVGLSQRFDQLGVPNLPLAAMRYTLRHVGDEPVRACRHGRRHRRR